VCNLPLDGAIAVVCDRCIRENRDVRFICRGYPATDGRLPIKDAPAEPFAHNRKAHEADTATSVINQAVQTMQDVATSYADALQEQLPRDKVRALIITMASHIAGRLLAIAASDDADPGGFSRAAVPDLARQIGEIGAELGIALRKAEAAVGTRLQ
jgi:hypothetical protein